MSPGLNKSESLNGEFCELLNLKNAWTVDRILILCELIVGTVNVVFAVSRNHSHRAPNKKSKSAIECKRCVDCRIGEI